MKVTLFRIDDYDNDLRSTCFEFFYWFSRLEFALKENEFGTAGRYGDAQVHWRKFIENHSKDFHATREGRLLVKHPPKRQIYADDRCGWEPLNLAREKTDLGKVVLVIKTIRNNLFHGGKGSQVDWDDPERNLFLLVNGKNVLDSLATMADVESDYLRVY